MWKLTVVMLYVAVTATPAAPQTPAAGQRFTPPGEARRVVEQFFGAYRELAVDRLVNLFAADALFEDPTFRQRQQGRDGIRQIAESMRATFSDVAIEVHSTLVDGDAVATEETISGVVTHRDGSRRHIKVRSASFFQVRNGQIQKLTQYSDVQTFNEQTRTGGSCPRVLRDRRFGSGVRADATSQTRLRQARTPSVRFLDRRLGRHDARRKAGGPQFDHTRDERLRDTRTLGRPRRLERRELQYMAPRERSLAPDMGERPRRSAAARRALPRWRNADDRRLGTA